MGGAVSEKLEIRERVGVVFSDLAAWVYVRVVRALSQWHYHASNINKTDCKSVSLSQATIPDSERQKTQERRRQKTRDSCGYAA